MKNNCKQRLKDAAFKLAKEKNIDQISLNEILKEAHVSKSSFYRNFDDKYGLFEEILYDLMSPLVNQTKQSLDYKTAAILEMEFVAKEKYFFANIHNSYYKEMYIDLSLNLYMNCFSKFIDNISEDEKAVLHNYIRGNIYTTIDWVKHGAKQSPKEVMRIINLAMPEILKKILL